MFGQMSPFLSEHPESSEDLLDDEGRNPGRREVMVQSLSSWTWNLLGTTGTYMESYSAHDKCYGRTEDLIPIGKV